MQNNEVRNIVWAYLSGRRRIQSFGLPPQYELLAYLYKEKAGSKADPKVDQCLFSSNYIKGILLESQEAELLVNYKEAVETCLSIDAGNRFNAEFTMPGEIAEFIYGFLGKPTNTEFYNPFSGLCSFPKAFKGNHFVCHELNDLTWAASKVRMHAHGIDADIRRCDAIEAMSSDSFKADAVICCPPFGMPKELSVGNITSIIYDHLNNGGICAMVVEAGFLFNQNKWYSDIRKRLVEDHAIKAIIALPAGLFAATSIQTAIVVFTKSHNESIFMYDASEEYVLDAKKKPHLDMEDIWEAMDETTSRNVLYEEISENANLLPGKYILPLDNSKQYVRLADLASVIAPSRPKELLGDFVNATLLSQGLPVHPVQPFKNTLSPNGTYYKVEEPVILFDYSEASSKVRVGYSEQTTGSFYAARSLVALVPNDKIIREYLMLQLQSDDVKKQLKNIATGSYLRRMSPAEIKELLIPIVPLEEQAKFVQEALTARMTESEKKRLEEFESYQREIHIRKHALSGKLSVISSRWNRLESYIRNNDGKLNVNDLIGKLHPVSVDDVIKQISTYINDAMIQVDNLADVEYDWGTPIKILPQDFIEAYEEGHRSTLYHVSILGQKDAKNSILFPKKALTRVFDDIFANAVTHGFTDKTRSDYQIQVDWNIVDGDVVIAISNNGTPLKEDAREEMVLSYGYSTSLNTDGHAGIGGHEIKTIMEKFGGEAEFVSTPEDEFKITYRLIFKDASMQ